LRTQPEFRDYPDFITVWGDEELPPQTIWSISSRGPHDIPIWALGQEPRADENGGDFACRLMDMHHGRGNRTRDNDEFVQLRTFGNRGNLDPRANVPSDDSCSRSKPAAQPVYYSLWHRRTDEYDRDHDMQLGTYSTREKAEQGLALLRDQLGFRDYPHSFEINWGRADETFETEGFVYRAVRSGARQPLLIRPIARGRTPGRVGTSLARG
jgi:hypothetical protein